MTHWNCALLSIGLVAVLAGCAAAGGAADGGKEGSSSDAGLDGGWTTHPIQGLPFCQCPGQTAANFTSAETGAQAVNWSRTFPSVTLASGDQFSLDIDFAGPASWTIGLEDTPGHVAFPTTGGPVLDPVNWNCVHAVYSLNGDQYEVFVNGIEARNEMLTFPSVSTLAGIDVQYSGSTASASWIDSIIITYLPKAGGSQTLLSESFDNPSSAGDGLLAGEGDVATPPVSIMIPGECTAL